MSAYIVDFINGTDVASFQTKNLSYTDKLNLTDEAVINIPGSSAASRSYVMSGTKVQIKRNGNIEFTGHIVGVSFLDAGGISIRCKDFMFKATKKKALSNVWSSTASATIFTALINNWDSSKLGTIATGVDLDFESTNSSSTSSVISNLRKKTDQDIEKDYANEEINIVDHKGSSTSVLVLNDYIDISNLGYDRAEPIGNVITVYGKGSGQNQIVSSSSYGQNASSISTWGEIEKTERDLTIVSQDEANRLADVYADKYGAETRTYTFSVNNPNQSLVSGDVITLNAPEKELVNEEVRITGIKRGLREGVEFMELEVSNKEYSELIRSTDKLIGDIQASNNDSETYNQDTTNVLTFSQMINANNTAPLRVIGNLPSDQIVDAVGNIRVNSFTLDYDVDPFRSGVGTATEQDVAPAVNGTSSSTSPGVSGTSSSTTPGVSGTSGEDTSFTSVGSDSLSTTSCTNNVWNTLAIVYPGSSHTNETLFANVTIFGSSGGPEDIQIRIGNDSIYGYIEPGVAGSGASVWGVHQENFEDGSFVLSGGINVGAVTSSSHAITLEVKPTSGAITLQGSMNIYTYAHDHSDGSYYANSHGHSDGTYVADSHGHGDGSYAAASHNHNVSVGDGISDSGSTNATSVNIYVDFWNGSSWVNKHSILSTGKTIDYDVDLSNGGTLPDAAGFWRARLTTNNANADLLQAVLKVKHNLNTQ